MNAILSSPCCLRTTPFRASANSRRRPILTSSALRRDHVLPGNVASLSATSANASQQPSATASVQVSSTAAPLLLSGISAGSLLILAGAASAADVNVLAQTAEGVELIQLAQNILRPLFTIFTLLYIVRIPMTWYPNLDFSKFPWAIAYAPTEPILSFTRKVVPLVNGVDITPIVWTGIISFLNEILLGPQGILTLLEREGGF